MTIELTKAAHTAAISSLERYFLEENGEPLGNMAAGALLTFFLADIDIELYEAPFEYWTKRNRKR